eukprot:CAMPEP_0202910678 /NCGR_PEP_ID=MMETSP1392-20130828/52695_1 /ASSEMBLY_ACC=CAM_ASM_000868 /TAXON_ID=225041 /ORGANISM="Chlamydomonas chlamydogama, Strain SAG 11-48b" /LENGTH=71 /DNA_ID=CAMNT_0049600851 /DNA_START=39 /DNA_END=251 /DNA_ORIENTATION=+
MEIGDKSQGQNTASTSAVVPTWRLVPGVCRESLALQVALDNGVPEDIVQHAEAMYRLLRSQQAQYQLHLKA